MKKILYTLFVLAFVNATSQAQQVLTLEECIEIALSNNLDIKRARNNAIAAASNMFQSKMNWLPSLNAGANHRWNEGLDFDVTAGRLVNTTTLGGGGSKHLPFTARLRVVPRAHFLVLRVQLCPSLPLLKLLDGTQ